MVDVLTQRKIQTVCLSVIATAVLTYMIYWLRPVLVPFVVALFVVSGVTPVLKSLEDRLGVSRLIASGITFLLGLAALALLGISLWLSVVQLAETGPAYRQRVGELVAMVEGWFGSDSTDDAAIDTAPPPSAVGATDNLDSDVQTSTTPDLAVSPPVELSTPTVQPSPGSLSDSLNAEQNATLKKFRATMDSYLRAGLANVSAELFSLVSTSIVVLIYVFFLLLGSAEVGAGKARNKTIQDIDNQVRTYLSLKTVISIVTGAAFGGALWLFGVPMSLTFGVLAFLLNYIPNIGPLVASILPVPFILLHPEGSLWWMLAAIGVTSTIQVVSGNVVEPKLMGDSSDLHPVVILLGLMFWGMMWGITGMFLATPMMSGLKIVLDRLDATKPIANILAGRWNQIDSTGDQVHSA